MKIKGLGLDEAMKFDSCWKVLSEAFFFPDERGPWRSDTESFCSLLGQEEGYKRTTNVLSMCVRVEFFDW